MRIFRKLLEFFGFFPSVLSDNLRNVKWYLNDYLFFYRNRSDDFPLAKPLPILTEKKVSSGRLSGHYFHQDLWVAQEIYRENPKRHLDVGSRTDGFVTHVASFREIEVLDIRPPEKEVQNIHFQVADLMQPNKAMYEYTDSLSCLHVLEHFGLGRYGDSLDPQGHLKGWENITKMLKPGGVFYFSTPIGPQRVEFNAHRVFSLRYLLSVMGEFRVEKFNYVDDLGDFHADIGLTDKLIEENASCWFGCGIFKLKKL